MNRALAFGVLLTGITLIVPLPAQDAKPGQAARDGLKPLNDFIGQWNGTGSPAKAKPGASDLWTETITWVWRFKGDDAWMEMAVKDGKYFQGGELRYLPDRSRFQMTAVEKGGRKLVLEGDYKDGYLRLEGPDPEKKESLRVTMNTAAEGIRFIFLVERKPEGRTLFTRDFLVASTREGQSLATGGRKVECVVSGGLGTMPVSYKGETFYVCCTGCRDAFNETPKKYIDEFRAKKAKP
jgi:hypothetical protein